MTRRKNPRYQIAIEISLSAQLHAPDELEADRRAAELLDVIAERLTGNICVRSGTRLAGDPVLDYQDATFSIEAL